MSTAYIGFGSNVGDRINHLTKAAKLLDDDSCRIKRSSFIYETSPFGILQQSNFLNAVVKVETEMSFQSLFKKLKMIEEKIGRTQQVRWGPREIDLDLLLFDKIVYSDEKIKIPHEGLSERDFVLVPLCEVSPLLVHPVLKKKICDICKEIPKSNILQKLTIKLIG